MAAKRKGKSGGARPTQETIAKILGVSKDTVSKALRNHPLTSKETRKRVQKIAEEIGYRPNPLVSALMTQLAQSRHGGGAAVEGPTASLAFLSGMPFEELGDARHSFRHWEGATRRAAVLGYGIEYFHVGADGMSDERLGSILTARGIRGVVLGVFPDRENQPHLEWDTYALAGLSPTFTAERVNLSRPDYFENARLLFKSLIGEGYERIGYCSTPAFAYYTKSIEEAGFELMQKTLSKNERIPMMYSDGKREEFVRWYETYRPDLVIAPRDEDLRELKRWMRGMGEERPDLVSFYSSEASGIVATMDHNEEAVGAGVVDLVVDQLHRNEFGLPEVPKKLIVPGSFVLKRRKKGRSD